MYVANNKKQLSFESFYTPFGGHLKADNRWVKAAEETDWEYIDEQYESMMSEKGMGARALDSRLVVGALMIKARMNYTDEETVLSISENPYMQFFLGYEGYNPEPPFDASTLTRVRERIPAEFINKMNKRLIVADIKKKDEEV